MCNKIHPSVRRISILSVFLGVAAMGGLAEAATFSVFAVSVNGSAIPSTNNVTVNPGDVVTLEFWGSDWSQEAQKLKFWQINIDADGYTSGDVGELIPFGLDNPQFGTAGVCASDDDCEAPLTCWRHTNGTPIYCAGPNNDPRLGAFIDSSRADYVYFNKAELSAVDYSIRGYRYGALLFNDFDAPVYTVPRHFATLILTATDDASGTFTVGPLSSGTEMRDNTPARNKILPLELEPVTIDVVAPHDPDCNGDPDCGVIPTVSAWGLMTLALLLLAGAKVHFNRRGPASA